MSLLVLKSKGICDLMVRERACNLKVAGSILAPAGIEGGDCE